MRNAQKHAIDTSIYFSLVYAVVASEFSIHTKDATGEAGLYDVLGLINTDTEKPILFAGKYLKALSILSSELESASLTD